MNHETAKKLEGETMTYCWDFGGALVSLELPSFGLICGNWNRAEKTEKFQELAAQYPGQIVRRVGVI